MDIRSLVSPKSIAVVGATERPSMSRTLIGSLGSLGFSGPVFPVNPKYSHVAGVKCYPDLADLPSAPDAVAIFTAGERAVPALRSAVAIGVKAATIYAGGFSEADGAGESLQAELLDICSSNGIALCGPNCMGILNPIAQSSTFPITIRDFDGLAGDVGLVAQSGRACITMLGDVRRHGFSLVVSAGNEAMLGVADYVDYLVDDPNTRVIATFIETIRQPDRWIAALDRAAAAGKPVVALKVGLSDRAKATVTSHTGGLAGESNVLSEVLRYHGAVEALDFDEFIEITAALRAKTRPLGRRIGLLTGSGGQAAMMLDLAESHSLDLPPIPDEVRGRVESIVGEVSGDGNPLDYGRYGNLQDVLSKLLDEAANWNHVDSIGLCTDFYDISPVGDPSLAAANARMLAAFSETSGKSVFLLNTRPGLINSTEANHLQPVGVAMLAGLRAGLIAMDRSAVSAPGEARPSGSLSPDIRLGGARRVINEYDAKTILGSCGIPTTREVLAHSLDEVRVAAASLGYPVVLKVVDDTIPHKTEHDLVKLRISDETALELAYHDLRTSLLAMGRADVRGLLVQEMVSDGIEVFAGVFRDPQFGLMLMFGLGGVGIELHRDFSIRKLPLRTGDAEAMISEVRGVSLLDGFRGNAPSDRQSIVDCLYALADFAQSNAESLAEVDINPIKVRTVGQGCVAVDALIVTSPIGAAHT